MWRYLVSTFELDVAHTVRFRLDRLPESWFIDGRLSAKSPENTFDLPHQSLLPDEEILLNQFHKPFGLTSSWCRKRIVERAEPVLECTHDLLARRIRSIREQAEHQLEIIPAR